MRIVDEAETVDWFLARGLVGLDGLRSQVTYSLRSTFPSMATFYVTELGARKKTALAKMLAARFCESGGGMLWIVEWGVWPSCENFALFYGYRKSLDETRLLDDSPGHIFTASDKETVFSLLSVAFYFIWGGVLSDMSGDVVLRFSHDESIDVFAGGDAESDNELLAVMAHWTGNQHD